MGLKSERRRQVAALRAQTRAYLTDIRVRRLSPPAAPLEPETFESGPALSYVPDPRIAALAPSQEGQTSVEAREATSSGVVANESRAVLKELPLASLRLLGQGMIWRLNNVGIRTLEDLAACEPERLGERLGPIGRLLRCEVWIEAAREILAAR